MPRTIDELTRVDDPAWPVIQEWIGTSSNGAKVIAGTRGAGEAVLFRLQMTARSMLGGVVLHCAALTVDHGWIKVLGAGVPGLPDPASASGFPDVPGDTPPVLPGLLVAVDAIGGQFAIDGGGLGAAPGEVCYWGPDSLSWVGLGTGHSGFLEWLLTGDHTSFYDTILWQGWQADAERLKPAQGFALYPFVWTKEYNPATASRTVVPLTEVMAINASMAAQLGPDLPLPWPGGEA